MAQDTITHFYESDHDRLDELFRTYMRFKGSDYTMAGNYFRQFKSGLLRHIIWEEEILFPLFERKTGTTAGGPTQVMRMEHRVIKAYLEEMYDQVQLRNAETNEAEKKLLEALSAHNRREEEILYPAIDLSLGGDEMSHVFKSMEQLAEERYMDTPPTIAGT